MRSTIESRFQQKQPNKGKLDFV